MFSLRASVAADGSETDGLTEYMQLVFGISYALLACDLIALTRTMLVNSTTPSNSCESPQNLKVEEQTHEVQCRQAEGGETSLQRACVCGRGKPNCAALAALKFREHRTAICIEHIDDTGSGGPRRFERSLMMA